MAASVIAHQWHLNNKHSAGFSMPLSSTHKCLCTVVDKPWTASAVLSIMLDVTPSYSIIRSSCALEHITMLALVTYAADDQEPEEEGQEAAESCGAADRVITRGVGTHGGRQLSPCHHTRR